MKKITYLTILTLAFLNSCGSLPRVAAPGLDGSSAKTHDISGCDLQLTVPAGWKGEFEGTTLHIIKDKIDIIVDVTSKNDIKEIQNDVLEKMKDLLDAKEIKSIAIRSRKSAGGVDIQVLPAYIGADSIDADAILCPSGKGAIILYSLSPLSTYKTDRPQVIAFADTAKSLAPPKK